MDTPEQKQSVELLEARRIRRLEQKRQRTFRRRTVLLILFIILILSTILIVRGCRRRSALPPDARHGRSDQEFSVQTEPDLVVNIAAVGDIISVQGATQGSVAIWSVTGQQIYSNRNWHGEDIDIAHLERGIYIININNTSLKFKK
jgi:hypothetical protein